MKIKTKFFFQHTFLSNSIYLYLSYFSDYLLAIIFLPFVSRALGAAEFGKVGIAQTLGILIILFVEFGSPLIATRKISRMKSDRLALSVFASEITTFKICLIPIVLIVTLIIVFFTPTLKSNLNYVVIVFFGSLFQGIAPIWYFHGIQNMRITAFIKLIFRLIAFIIIFYFVESSNDGWIVLSAFSVSSGLICFFLYFLMFKQIGIIKLKFSSIFNLLNKSIPSFLITILPIIYQAVSIFIMSIFISPIQLGFFFGASRIHRALNALFGPISQAFYPIIASEKNNHSKVLIKKYLFFMFITGFMLFLVGFAFAENIIMFLLGVDFLPAFQNLKFFVIVLPLTAISNALGRQWLMKLDQDFNFALIQLFSTLVGFLTFIMALPKMGINSFPLSLIIYEFSSIIMILILISNGKNAKLF